MIRTPELRSTWARAVVPVLAGIVFFAVAALGLWGIAALSSAHPNEQSELFSSTTFRRIRAVPYAALIAADGPVLLPDLQGVDGDLTVVLDHTGNDPTSGWRMYLAYPADRPVTCKVTQLPRTRTFRDCDQRTLDVAQLALPKCGMRAFPDEAGIVEIDLTPDPRQEVRNGVCVPVAGATSPSTPTT